MGVVVERVLSAEKALREGDSQSAFWGQLADTVGTLIGNQQANKQTEAQLQLERERARQAAIAALGNDKPSYVPILVIGGVLLIGTFVVISVLKD